MYIKKNVFVNIKSEKIYYLRNSVKITLLLTIIAIVKINMSSKITQI